MKNNGKTIIKWYASEKDLLVDRSPEAIARRRGISLQQYYEDSRTWPTINAT